MQQYIFFIVYIKHTHTHFITLCFGLKQLYKRINVEVNKAICLIYFYIYLYYFIL